MKKTQKGNTAVIALIIVIVAITAGVIGFLFAKRAQAPAEKVTTTQPSVQTQQVQQPAQSVDETADWQTYQDNTLGIEFRFPTYFGDIRVNEIDALENMGVQEGKKIAIELDGKANISIAAYTDDFESFSPFEFAYQSDYNCPKPLSYGEGGDACKTVMMPAGDMVLRNVLREIEGGIYPKTAVLVNNKSDSEFTKIAFTISFDDFNKRVQSMYDAVDDKKRQKAFTEGTVYSKKIMGGGDLSRADNTDLAIFNKIVSTLKFTDATADETANWQTYRNEEYGFEFKYPNDWKIDKTRTTSNEIVFDTGIAESRETIKFIKNSVGVSEISPEERVPSVVRDADMIEKKFEMMVAGEKALVVATTEFGTAYVIFNHGTNSYIVTTGGKVMDEVLPTLKFTK